MAVFSSQLKLKLTTSAIFGDVGDIFTREVIKSQGGTIKYTINVTRQFVSGDYIMHVVRHVDGRKVVIICLDGLDALKIHNTLLKSDVGNQFDLSNYISRYDWMHFRNWSSKGEEFENNGHKLLDVLKAALPVEKEIPRRHRTSSSCSDNSNWRSTMNETDNWERAWGDFSEDEDENEVEDDDERYRSVGKAVLFVNLEEVSMVHDAKVTVTRENEWTYILRSNATKKVIGYMFQASPFIEGDWHYGCVLVDKDSSKCFAFVFEDMYTNESLGGNYTEFKEKQSENNYTYSMDQFK